MLWTGERRNPSFFYFLFFPPSRNPAYFIVRFFTQCFAFYLNSFYIAPVIFYCCPSEMTVVLCQTTYTPDGNPFIFHLKLISLLLLSWSQDEQVCAFPGITHIYCVPQMYERWPTICGIPLNISIQYDTASCMDVSHSLSCSSSYLICYAAFLLVHIVR